MRRTRHFLFLLLTVAGMVAPILESPVEAQVKVVTSLTTYGAIAREIVGDKGTVTAIAQGDEDPHFVQPNQASWPCSGTRTCSSPPEWTWRLWVPALLDRANNRKVSEGGPGYVTAYTGIDLVEVPATVNRSEGDIHVAGNPHIHTDPLNGIIIARNILTGLQRVSPSNSAYFTQQGTGSSSESCSKPPWGRRSCRSSHPDRLQPA